MTCTCIICGKEFKPYRDYQETCGDMKCVQLRNDQKRSKQRGPKSQMSEAVYVLLHDPIPPEEGGFAQGMRLSTLDITAGLNNGSFARGTILKDVKHGQVKIITEKGLVAA